MKIKETEIFQALSKMSNSERGIAFEQVKSRIEDKLNCKLIQRNYMDLDKLNGILLPYLDRCNNIVWLMEFSPNKAPEKPNNR